MNLTFGTGLGIGIQICLACGGAAWIIVCIEGPAVIERILTHPDAKTLKPEAWMRPPGRAPPNCGLSD